MAGCTRFTVNGTAYTVNAQEYNSDYTLNQFLRDEAHLKGTKAMCREGGCGVCVVTASAADGQPPITINSCLISIHQCNGWAIWTVEGTGNRSDGYGKVQKMLADNNGSQCGYCSPGMVMAILGSVEWKKNGGSVPQLDTYLDGNICRCTGYRPILKTLYDVNNLKDIEDLTGCCGKGETSTNDKSCAGCCSPGKECAGEACELKTLDGKTWLRPCDMKQLLDAINKSRGKTYYLVAGHTGETVFDKEARHDVYIDINGISELRGFTGLDLTTGEVKIGANVSLTSIINSFSNLDGAKAAGAGFEYLIDLGKQLNFLGNIHVRNKGTWIGNLMMKKAYPLAFPSDVYMLFEAGGCLLDVVDSGAGSSKKLTLREFLQCDMTGQVVVSACFSSKPGWKLATYKVGPRYQNNLAHVNVAMLAKLSEGKTVTERPNLCIGGLEGCSADIESYLVGKKLCETSTIQGVMFMIESVGAKNSHLDDKTLSTRTILAKNLVYKAFLKLCGESVPEFEAAGGESIRRSAAVLKSADFQTDESKWPMTKYMPKVDSVKQTAGEAEFVGDMPVLAGQLFAVFVKSSQANAKIKRIQTEEALSCPGVVRVLTAKDIPGQNRMPQLLRDDEIFLAQDQVYYHGQPVAIVVAESEEQAYAARKQVIVEYTDIQKPLLYIDEAIKAGKITDKPVEDVVKGDTQQDFGPDVVELSGCLNAEEQYHFHMETQTAFAVPHEGLLKIYSATQMATPLKLGAAALLGISSNKVDVEVRRVGGSFGGKIGRSGFPSNGAALAAYLTNRPVRLCLNMEDNMEICGKRSPFKMSYKVKVNKTSMKLVSMEARVYQNCGHNGNEATLAEFGRTLENAYYCPNWDLKSWNTFTNRAAHCFARSPGTTTATMYIEQIMDRIAATLSVDPVALRELNLYEEGQENALGQKLTNCLIKKVWNETKTKSEYEKRKVAVDEFNSKNKWRKRGLAHMPLKYFQNFFTMMRYTVHVMINVDGGNVTLIPAGVEMGQGLNTKCIQVAAATLGVPVEMVEVQPTTATFNHLSSPSGGSIASDLNCYATKKACEKLLERINPIKNELPEGTPWYQVIFTCFMRGVDLQERYLVSGDDLQEDHDKFVYNIYGSMVTEVELDVLSGQFVLQRADLLYDCGECYSPAIDIGQIEGSVVMGLGYHLTEEMKYDQQTGALKTKNTWTYKPPMIGDIPVDFRVSLLKDSPCHEFPLRSKVVGEPPLLLSASAVCALRYAITAFRKQKGDNSFVDFDTPLTVEKILKLCNVTKSDYQGIGK